MLSSVTATVPNRTTETTASAAAITLRALAFRAGVLYGHERGSLLFLAFRWFDLCRKRQKMDLVSEMFSGVSWKEFNIVDTGGGL